MRTKLTVLAFSLSAVMATSAFAGDIKPLHGGFTGDLTSGFPKKDKLKGVCPTGTSPAVASVKARVKDRAPVQTPVVRVIVRKLSTNSCASSVAASGLLQSDTVDGDATFSGVSSVAAVNGTPFMIEVDKTSTTSNAAELYELDYHCENGTLDHPVPALTYCQNQ